MSLTSWVRWDEALIDLVIDATWPGEVGGKGWMSWIDNPLLGSLRAAPLTKNYAVVGTAFDYAARIFVQRENSKLLSPRDISPKGNLVALGGLCGDNRRKRFIKDFWGKLAAGVALDDLLPDCVVLAHLDSVARSGRDVGNAVAFGVDSRDVDDLRNLVGLLDKDKWVAEKQCVLNPTFGESGVEVGGADADVVLDGMLIDIKTTKYLDFRKEYLRQLVGYYILNLREGDEYSIHHLGVYFSRHGILASFWIPMCPAEAGVSKDLGVIDSNGRKYPACWGAVKCNRGGEELSVWDVIEDSLQSYSQELFGDTDEDYPGF